jgi:hypothetical protein
MCITLAASGFWALLLAGLVGHFFEIDGDRVLLFVALPVGILFATLLMPRMRKVLGFSRR